MTTAKSRTRRIKAVSQSAHIDAVAQLFDVLSEPSRLRILHALESGPANVNELVENLEMKQANVSKQLGILHQSGLLQRTRVGNQIRYSIRMQLVFKLCDLVCHELHREAVVKAQTLLPLNRG